jgi:glucose/arabinose dehydrogenase
MKSLLLVPVAVVLASVYLTHHAPAPQVHAVGSGTAPVGPLLTGQAALGDWATDAPGVRRKLTVDTLPVPHDTPSVDNGAHMVPRPDGVLPKAPPGFQVTLFASDLSNPRKIVTAPNGDIFVAESGANRVKILRFADGADHPQTVSVYADDLRQPFGIAFYPSGPNPKFVYVANTDSVVRYPYQNGDLKATGAAQMIVPDIPGGGRLRGGGHWTRDIVFSADDKTMFVSVGSHSNHDDSDTHPEEFHRADILAYHPDGSAGHVYASGIRNPVGIAVQPGTGTLWTSVNERDTLGDFLVPDYITHVTEGGFYGWPWYYMGKHQDPDLPDAHPDLKARVITPDVLLQPHMASLALTFYEGKQFPAKYRGMIFAAEHGSWNRSHRTGYKVICVPISKNGQAEGEFDDFLTGFVTPSGDVWGRPVGVTVAHDGSLLVSDDGSNSIWRVRYVGK